MKVSDAMRSRIACRAFLPDPIPESTIRAILEDARFAPSGGNLQPWLVHVVTGAALAALVDDVAAKLARGEGEDGWEYRIYPENLPDPYRTRRFECGADLYAELGIERQDRAARRSQFERNFNFFGAPAALFITIDRRLGPPQWSDVGMFIQNVLLLAREHGLHTCPQEAWAGFYRTVAAHLDLEEAEMLFCAIALGHMDVDARVNRLRTRRAEVAEFARFHSVRR